MSASFTRWLVLLFVLGIGPAMAASAGRCVGDAPNREVASNALPQYMISAVLRKDTDGMQIKLVHSRQVAGSANEATLIFLRSVRRQYAGYSVLDTLVSELDATPSSCPQRGIFDVLHTTSQAPAGRDGACTITPSECRREALNTPALAQNNTFDDAVGNRYAAVVGRRALQEVGRHSIVGDAGAGV